MDQIYAYIQKQLAICEPGDSQLQILRQMKISNDEKIKYYLSMQGWSGAIQPKGLEFLKLCEQFVWECENENYEDYDLCDQLGVELNNHTYVSYAQKRFMENRGVPNPIIAKDTFTQWILSMKC